MKQFCRIKLKSDKEFIQFLSFSKASQGRALPTWRALIEEIPTDKVYTYLPTHLSKHYITTETLLTRYSYLPAYLSTQYTTTETLLTRHTPTYTLHYWRNTADKIYTCLPTQLLLTYLYLHTYLLAYPTTYLLRYLPTFSIIQNSRFPK